MNSKPTIDRMHKPTSDLYKIVADGGYQYAAGMLSAICVFQGAKTAAELAKWMRLPVEVPLYAVRQATGGGTVILRRNLPITRV